MSQLEKDLEKAQTMKKFTEPIDLVIKNLPAETRYYKSRQLLRNAINEILNAAIAENAS